MAAGRIRAVEHARECEIGERGVPELKLAAAECHGGLFREIGGQVRHAQSAERTDRFLALVEPREREPAQDRRLIRVLAGGMPKHQRVCPGDHLTPQALRLELPPVALGLPGRFGETVRVVHPVVVDAAAEQQDARDEREARGATGAAHRAAPESGDVPVFRSYSSRYSTMASAIEEAMAFWLLRAVRNWPSCGFVL